eukprot:TRINITY_DN33799_c0_g1_i1.p1 TRINITY_DN33799_c0_g1~~TRINITY_DN33799_c0_g1_i1.p1  ORF type:complete len:203 (+),score=22.67 TRINITY_DN33799_c0_g1_i1:88-696(+)
MPPLPADPMNYVYSSSIATAKLKADIDSKPRSPLAGASSSMILAARDAAGRGHSKDEPGSPQSWPGSPLAKRKKPVTLSKDSTWSSLSTDAPTSPGAASCPDLHSLSRSTSQTGLRSLSPSSPGSASRRWKAQMNELSQLPRRSPHLHPRPVAVPGFNLKGSGSMSNWRDYTDDIRNNPNRGVRGGLAPTAWYKTLNGNIHD